MRVHWLTVGFCFSIGRGAFGVVPPAVWDVEQAPASISAEARIAPEGEPGTPLTISGTVYAPDGNTRLAGVVVYGYHTDVNGVYRPDRRYDEAPRLRGWARTDAAGHYSFKTIRPAPYPSRAVPAHVHFHVWGPGVPRQFVEDLKFRDDPLITPEQIAESSGRGKFATLCSPQRAPDGGQQCTFDIRVQAQSNFR
jgi:protocatechuate 3,4-dioxygenase beta subunit